MNELRCACADCSCTVDANALQLEGKVYCCEACASGHRMWGKNQGKRRGQCAGRDFSGE